MEIRAMAIAFFYAVATALGGITGPLLFSRLVDDPGRLAIGFLVAAVLMAIAAVVEFVLGIDAEGEALEDIATPLTAEAAAGRRADRFSRPGWSPSTQASVRPRADREREREVARIAEALAEAGGPMDRRALANAVGARHWGTGRFSTALSEAVRRGQARRVGRAHYETAGDREAARI
jgi:MFS family permease